MSTRKRQDWSRATSIYFTEDPPREQEDPDDMVGFYDIRRRHLWIDPNTEEKTADWEVPRTKAGTLSHEISHFKLGHESLNLYAGQDRESRERLFERLVEFSQKMGPLADYKLHKIRDYIQELEVRIFQETQGYLQDKDDRFIDYFREEYIIGNAEFHATGKKSERLVPLEAARQAVQNMVRKGHITNKQGFNYLRDINAVVRNVHSASL